MQIKMQSDWRKKGRDGENKRRPKRFRCLCFWTFFRRRASFLWEFCSGACHPFWLSHHLPGEELRKHGKKQARLSYRECPAGMLLRGWKRKEVGMKDGKQKTGPFSPFLTPIWFLRQWRPPPCLLGMHRRLASQISSGLVLSLCSCVDLLCSLRETTSSQSQGDAALSSRKKLLLMMRRLVVWEVKGCVVSNPVWFCCVILVVLFLFYL